MFENPATNTTESDFEKTLIDRFFNPRSYFLNSFLTSLRQREETGLESGHTIAVGLLMDEIVNAEDKSAILASLDTLSAFSRYHEQLKQGIEYLQHSRLSTQQMMEIVGSLGSSFADTLIDLISDDDSRLQLFRSLGIESGNLDSILKKEDPAQDEFAAVLEEVDSSDNPINEKDDLTITGIPPEFPEEMNPQTEGLNTTNTEDPQSKLEDQIKLDLSDLTTDGPADLSTSIETEATEKSTAPQQSKTLFSREETQPFKSEDFKADVSPEAGEGMEPWSHFKDDVNEKLQGLENNLKRFSLEPDEWKWFKGIIRDFRDLRDWAMIQGDEGIEALSHKILLLIETVYLRGSDNRFAIFGTLANVLDALHVLNDAGRGSERLDVVRLVANQIDQQRRIYPEAFSFQDEFRSEGRQSTTESPESRQSTSDNGISEEIDSIEQQSMDSLNFQGEEPETKQPPEIEEVYKFSDETKPDIEAASSSESESEGFDSIRESELLSELMSEDLDMIDDPLQKPENTEPSNKTGESESEAVEMETSDRPHGPGHTQETSSKKDGDEEWRIPGEEDDDLLDILNHIKNEVTEFDSGVMKTDSPPDKIEKSVEGQTGSESAEKWTSHSESSEPMKPGKTEPVKQKKQEEQNDGGDGFDYVTEAEMYFSFSRRALQDLMRNPSKKQALEDSELAFYSLRVLAQRLNYHIVNEIMTFSEKLVQSKLVNKKALSTAQVNSLYTIINEIEQACRERKLNESSRKSWLQQQSVVLKKWVASRSADSLQIEPMNSTSNKDKKSDDDPLDFLLFDDTSKFFKQLLKE